MLTINVNGQDVCIQAEQDLASVVEQFSQQNQYLAAVLNGELIPRHSWQQTQLKSQDSLELFAAVAGG